MGELGAANPSGLRPPLLVGEAGHVFAWYIPWPPYKGDSAQRWGVLTGRWTV